MIDRFVLVRNESPLVSRHWKHENGCWLLAEAAVSVEADDALIRLQKRPLASCTFFYACSVDLFVASSSWREVVKTLRDYGVPLSCEPNYVWQYLESPCPLTNKTFCRDVYVLRAGEEVEQHFGAEPKALLREYVPFKPNDMAVAPDLRKLISNSLLEIPMERTAFHLSAGLDSSILVILARELNPDLSIKSFSCRTLGKGPGDELSTVQRLADEYCLEFTVFDFTESDVFQEGKRLIEALHYPIAHPSHLTRFLLDKAIAAENIRYVVTGRGADECLAGYPWHLPAYADPRMHRVRVLATTTEVLQSIFKEKWHGVSYSGWSEPHPLGLKDRLQYDWWTIFESWNVVDISFEMLFNFNYLNPFLNKSLVNELLSMPESRLIPGNIQKCYLKEYFKNTYPKYILEYPKHGLTIDINAYLMNYSTKEIMDAIFSDFQFAHKYLRQKGVEKLIDKTLTGVEKCGWQIWGLYLCSLASQKLDSLAQREDKP